MELDAIFYIGTLMGIGISIFLWTLLFKANKSNKNIVKAKVEPMHIDDVTKTLDFFNSILELKFQYYLNTYFIAYFVNDKDLDIKDIKKYKKDFYMDVSKMLCDDQKNQLLKVFSIEGIELYIHQTFLRLLNSYNIKFKNSNSGNLVDDVHTRTLQAIYKGD